jgi:hypothetical protein
MPRPARRPASDPPETGTPDQIAPEPAVVAPTPAATAMSSLADLPVAGLTRRRVAILIAALVAAWVIVLFARQVSEASEATARADAMRTSTALLQADVGGLESELALIRRQAYIEQAARGYRLGTPNEIPFALADDAPALPADAPGSATVRLGTGTVRVTPIESWTRLLFGDPRDASGG